MDSYVPARAVDPYRARPPLPVVDPYRRDDDRFREREYDRRSEDYRSARPREEWPTRERERERERRWEDDTRRGYKGDRRQTSKEREWARQREEDMEMLERSWARQREEDRERQWARQREEDRERWARLREEDRRLGRDRPHEIEPERKWIPRASRSPGKGMLIRNKRMWTIWSDTTSIHQTPGSS